MNSTRIAAVFDIDGTLVAGDSLERIFIRFLWRRGELNWRELVRCGAATLAMAATGRRSVRASKIYLKGKDVLRIRRLARECFDQEIVPRLLPQAIDRLRWHQAAGHFVILLSGTLDLLLELLAEYLGVSARIGTRLELEGRYLTGRLAGVHPFGEAKAECLMVMSRLGLFNRKRSFAYADAYPDRHLLACVGNPVATNPDARLRLLAGRRGWMMEDFTLDKRPLLSGGNV
ncbi:MAG TPA: HAD-IB family hydrolase [Blastocatellia bacterium]|nr:HAD-IB family hydrolase [Blastocatellia bacterium]